MQLLATIEDWMLFSKDIDYLSQSGVSVSALPQYLTSGTDHPNHSSNLFRCYSASAYRL